MKGKHQKHPPLKRPSRGLYHRTEWAVYGTTCGEVEELYRMWQEGLSDYKLMYVDADHQEHSSGIQMQVGAKQFGSSTDHLWSEYDDKLQQWASDAVIVNGNHYPATRQIVCLNPKKRDSLFRRLPQLTDVDVVLVEESDDEIYDFLTDVLTDQTLVLKKDDRVGLIKHLSAAIEKGTPEVKALVLAGGKSQRMGEDKSKIVYYDKSQQEHVADLCKGLGLDTYISKGHDFRESTVKSHAVLSDKYVGLGPLGGILTAFMYDPDAAWLVLACDLPLLNEGVIKELLSRRNSRQQATAVLLSDQQFPEPLTAIYEPTIYQRMLRFLSLGYACPRKVLINSATNTISLEDESPAYNANTPAEKLAAMTKIKR